MAKNKNKYTMFAVDFNEQLKQIGTSATVQVADNMPGVKISGKRSKAVYVRVDISESTLYELS